MAPRPALGYGRGRRSCPPYPRSRSHDASQLPDHRRGQGRHHHALRASAVPSGGVHARASRSRASSASTARGPGASSPSRPSRNTRRSSPRGRGPRHRRGDAALPARPGGGGAHPCAHPRGPADRLAAQPGRPGLFDLPDEPAQPRPRTPSVPFARGDADRPQPAGDLRGAPRSASSRSSRASRCGSSCSRTSRRSRGGPCGELFAFLGRRPGLQPRSREGRQSRRRAAQQGRCTELLANRRLVGGDPRRAARARWSSRSRRCAAATSQAARSRPRTARDGDGFFRDDILRTQDLIGRDLSHWLTGATRPFPG